MKKSIVWDIKECYVCATTKGLHRHHIFFGTANRKISERLGLTVFLCYEHHEGVTGVHHNRDLDLELKRLAQSIYEEDHTREDWMQHIGKNYLD